MSPVGGAVGGGAPGRCPGKLSWAGVLLTLRTNPKHGSGRGHGGRTTRGQAQEVRPRTLQTPRPPPPRPPPPPHDTDAGQQGGLPVLGLLVVGLLGCPSEEAQEGEEAQGEEAQEGAAQEGVRGHSPPPPLRAPLPLPTQTPTPTQRWRPWWHRHKKEKRKKEKHKKEKHKKHKKERRSDPVQLSKVRPRAWPRAPGTALTRCPLPQFLEHAGDSSGDSGSEEVPPPLPTAADPGLTAVRAAGAVLRDHGEADQPRQVRTLRRHAACRASLSLRGRHQEEDGHGPRVGQAAQAVPQVAERGLRLIASARARRGSRAQQSADGGCRRGRGTTAQAPRGVDAGVGPAAHGAPGGCVAECNCAPAYWPHLQCHPTAPNCALACREWWS